MMRSDLDFDKERIKKSIKRRQKVGQVVFVVWAVVLLSSFGWFAWYTNRTFTAVNAKLDSVEGEVKERIVDAETEIRAMTDKLRTDIRASVKDLEKERTNIKSLRAEILSLQNEARAESKRLGTAVTRALRQQERKIASMSKEAEGIVGRLGRMQDQMGALEVTAGEAEKLIQGMQETVGSLAGSQADLSETVSTLKSTVGQAKDDYSALAAEVDTTRQDVDRKFIDLARKSVERTYWLSPHQTQKDSFLRWQVSVGEVSNDTVRDVTIIDESGEKGIVIKKCANLEIHQTCRFKFRSRNYRLVVDAIIGARKGLGAFTMISKGVKYARVSVVPEYATSGTP